LTTATFVLSTGRCGTQLLARVMQRRFPEARVEHEPLHEQYGDPSAHFDSIEETLQTRDYIETGFPWFRAADLVRARFAGRLRIIHLVRHPIPVALSWLTQRAYCPPLLPHLREKVLIPPGPDYAACWPELTPYEKCLYYWLRVNTLGRDLADERLTFEEVLREADGVVDEHRYLLAEWYDPGLIARHPAVVDLARELGYDALDYDEEALRRRYWAQRL
jgi:hypothetical protein